MVVNGPVYAGTISSNYAKAQVANGALYKGGALAGTIQVKVGKADKKGYVKISGTATLLDDGKAKKVMAKGVRVALDAQERVPPVAVAFKSPISEMKLAYTPKTGIFKGAFKIYAVQDGKLKKFTVRVVGVVVDGKGQGSATGPGGAGFAVTVE